MALLTIALLLIYPILCHSLPPNASTLLNTTRIFPLSPLLSTLSPNVSRDAPFILHLPPSPDSKVYKPFWVFSDTETFSSQGSQSGFVSNSAAWDDSDREAILEAVMMGKDPYLALRVTDVVVTPDGAIRSQWIPHTGEELAFNTANKKQANGGLWERIALWPNCPPTVINQTHSFLYCSIVEVTPPKSTQNTTVDPKKDVGWFYTFKGISLVSIVKDNAFSSGDSKPSTLKPLEVLTPKRVVPKMFSEKEVAWGNFGALVGQCPQGTQGNIKENGRCVYPIAIGARGLMFASVPLDKLAQKKSYTYFDTASRVFNSISPSHDSHTATFLNGTFSSGNLFFSEFYQTFLIVYFNRLVDNSFYIRFLDRQHPLYIMKAGRIQYDAGWPINKTLTAGDVEAIGHYTWSGQYKLYETEQGKGGFSYAGSVGVDYFSGLGEEEKGRNNTSWVLLTWTEQTGERIEYKTGGAVVGFTRKLVNPTNTTNDWELEYDLLNETYPSFPWDDIYTRPELENETSGSGPRVGIVVPVVAYAIAICVGVFSFN